MHDLSFVQFTFVFEQDELFMFQLYLIFIIIFLIPICYLVAQEVFRLLVINRSFKTLAPFHKSQKLTKEHVLSLAKIYVQKKQWLSCILMLELYIKIDNENLGEYYNTIAFCYQLINLNYLAKQFYSQAIKASPSNILFLKNLAKINWLSKDLKAAINIYKQILVLDPQNQVALDSVDFLSKKI